MNAGYVWLHNLGHVIAIIWSTWLNYPDTLAQVLAITLRIEYDFLFVLVFLLSFGVVIFWL